MSLTPRDLTRKWTSQIGSFVPERDHVRPARATPAADVSVAVTVDNGRGFNIPLTKDMWVAGDQASDHDKSDGSWAGLERCQRAASRHALAKKPEKRELHAKFAFIQGIPG